MNRVTVRTAALVVCAVVAGSFAVGAPAIADAPGGTACQTDGKISGRGSTTQGNVLAVLIGGYNAAVCGNVPGATNLNPGITSDPAGSNMLVYNWGSSTTTLSPTAADARGSGEGLASQACRTDAFGGTDIPYNVGRSNPYSGTLPWLWVSVPHTTPPFSATDGSEWPYFDPVFGQDGSNGCDSFYGDSSGGSGYQTAWLPPYPPAPNAGCSAAGPPACYPSTVGGVTNDFSPLMTIPIAVASAALGVNFKPGGAQISGCPTTPSQVQLTATQVSHIFSGEVANWDQLSSSAFNWSTCNEPITRIVRGDISGTTQEMKTYLQSVDGSRTLCDGFNTWTTLSTYGNNTTWPGDSADACAGVTAPVAAFGTGGGSGCPIAFNPDKGVICVLAVTGGGITYGDLSNWKSTANVMYAEVVPVSGTTGVLAGSSATLGAGAPNCDTSFSANTPGTGGATDLVGLDDDGGTPDEPTNTNWAIDAAAGSAGVPPSDIANIPGSLKWPICTLTYDMVYAGLSENSVTYPANAIGGLTPDQRRTLYTFFAYALAPGGQSLLKPAGYLPLPSIWATEERLGFENGF